MSFVLVSPWHNTSSYLHSHGPDLFLFSLVVFHSSWYKTQTVYHTQLQVLCQGASRYAMCRLNSIPCMHTTIIEMFVFVALVNEV
jgi:hypothetical protein